MAEKRSRGQSLLTDFYTVKKAKTNDANSVVDTPGSVELSEDNTESDLELLESVDKMSGDKILTLSSDEDSHIQPRHRKDAASKQQRSGKDIVTASSDDSSDIEISHKAKKFRVRRKLFDSDEEDNKERKDKDSTVSVTESNSSSEEDVGTSIKKLRKKKKKKKQRVVSDDSDASEKSYEVLSSEEESATISQSQSSVDVSSESSEDSGTSSSSDESENDAMVEYRNVMSSVGRSGIDNYIPLLTTPVKKKKKRSSDLAPFDLFDEDNFRERFLKRLKDLGPYPSTLFKRLEAKSSPTVRGDPWKMLQRWQFMYIDEDADVAGECTCGNEGLRWLFVIQNRDTSRKTILGSECIKWMDNTHVGLMVMDLVNRMVAQRVAARYEGQDERGRLRFSLRRGSKLLHHFRRFFLPLAQCYHSFPLQYNEDTDSWTFWVARSVNDDLMDELVERRNFKISVKAHVVKDETSNYKQDLEFELLSVGEKEQVSKDITPQKFFH